MTSKAQRVMLFGFWRDAKAILMKSRQSGSDRETWTKLEEKQRRDELTIRALGRHKSWSDLTQLDVDNLKAELLAVIRPGDLNSQLRQQNMQTRRMHYGLRSLMRELRIDLSYVTGIVRRMNENGELASNRLDNLGADDLRKVMIALRKQQARQRDVASSSGALARNYELRPATYLK